MCDCKLIKHLYMYSVYELLLVYVNYIISITHIMILYVL